MNRTDTIDHKLQKSLQVEPPQDLEQKILTRLHQVQEFETKLQKHMKVGIAIRLIIALIALILVNLSAVRSLITSVESGLKFLEPLFSASQLSTPLLTFPTLMLLAIMLIFFSLIDRQVAKNRE